MKATTIFLSRNGLLEPLGQGQIFEYLKGLSKEFNIILITMEKDGDLSNSAAMESMRAKCEDFGVNWFPRRFVPRRKFIRAIAENISIISLIRRIVSEHNVAMIHARSYIPALWALIARKTSGVPYLFDMRGLWVEELITGRRLKRGSFAHSAALRMERMLLSNSSGIVVLTEAAKSYLHKTYRDVISEKAMHVIPTCVNLDTFKPSQVDVSERVFGCLGSVLTGWFRIDMLKDFMSVCRELDKDSSFKITSRDNPAQILHYLGEDLMAHTSVEACVHDRVSDAIAGQLASVMFYAGGCISELGRSPTRLAEVLACGIPVISNSGVGDVADIISRNRVGVIVNGSSRDDFIKAFQELMSLRQEGGLSDRCRSVSRDIFSIESGRSKFLTAYNLVLYDK